MFIETITKNELKAKYPNAEPIRTRTQSSERLLIVATELAPKLKSGEVRYLEIEGNKPSWRPVTKYERIIDNLSQEEIAKTEDLNDLYTELLKAKYREEFGGNPELVRSCVCTEWNTIGDPVRVIPDCSIVWILDHDGGREYFDTYAQLEKAIRNFTTKERLYITTSLWFNGEIRNNVDIPAWTPTVKVSFDMFAKPEMSEDSPVIIFGN